MAVKPFLINFLKSSKYLPFIPPKTSKKSLLNLNGAVSNLIPLPRLLDNKN
jgi:hypothetical protein